MNKRSAYPAVAGLALTVFLGATILTGSNSMADEDCTTLINSKCTSCHYKSRICKKLGKKRKGAWKSTIKRMKRHGAEISKEEQKALVKCLFALKPGAEAGCKDVDPAEAVPAK